MPHSKTYSVTVVVPIYHVEQYIERCAVSLFEQDFDDIEYIFVDDASPDNSVAILQDVIACYPQRATHVHIIRNAENLGLFETRKIGVMAAKGKYIQHIDSDDWVEIDMISTLCDVAATNQVDVILYDFYIETQGGVDNYQQPYSPSRDKLLTALLAMEIKANIWGHFVKRSLYLVVYKELNLTKRHNMGEDKLVIIPMYYLMSSIDYVPRSFYHYNRVNQHSLTTVYTEQAYTDDRFLFSFLSEFLAPKVSESQLELFKNKMYLRFLNESAKLRGKTDLEWLRENGFGLRRLWAMRQVAFLHKLLYSLHFVNLSWGVVIIRYFRTAYRGIKRKIRR